MRPDWMECPHDNYQPIGGGWRRCSECLEEFRPRYDKRPPDRPHLVNGYYLSEADYEIVRGYRRARDYAIGRAKEDYQAKLASFLQAVKRQDRND